MSNLWVNIRLWRIHFQIRWDWPYLSLSYNDYHRLHKTPFFQVHKFFGLERPSHE